MAKMAKKAMSRISRCIMVVLVMYCGNTAAVVSVVAKQGSGTFFATRGRVASV